MTSPLMLYAGGRYGDMTITSGTASEQTGGIGYDTSYADCSINMNANCLITFPFADASGSTISVTSGQTAAIHTTISTSRGLIAGQVITMYNSSGQPWVRINCPSNTSPTLQYNSNTGASPTWVTLGSSATSNGGTFDVSVTIGSSGTHTVLFALNSTTIYTGTFTNSNLTNLASFTIFNTDPVGQMYISEVMASRDIGLVGARLKTLRATGAGTYSQWTGSYTDVNEQVTNDATYNVTATANQLESFAMTDITLPAQYSVASVFYKFRVRNDGGGTSPQNVQALVRSGGTDYLSANLAPVTAAYGYVGIRYDTDPATGSAWTQTGVNALELGYKSIT